MSIQPSRFEAALAAMSAELSARSGVVGLLHFGSSQRGEAQEHSDVDLYAITSGESSGHIGRRVLGVPVEVSFGSVAQMRARIEREAPAVVHAFASGSVLLDRSGQLRGLCEAASALWARGPTPLSEKALLVWRFRLTEMALDLEDMTAEAPSGRLAGADCVRLAIEAFCAIERIWLPPLRHAFGKVAERDSSFASRIALCAAGGFPALRALGVADALLARIGGRLEDYDTGAAAP
jgi:hypothetical protein